VARYGTGKDGTGQNIGICAKKVRNLGLIRDRIRYRVSDTGE
jgi:hypothetical protein